MGQRLLCSWGMQSPWRGLFETAPKRQLVWLEVRQQCSKGGV